MFLKISLFLVWKIQVFRQKTKLERLYFREKVWENAISGRWRFKLYK
jgi:hypothetical protein